MISSGKIYYEDNKKFQLTRTCFVHTLVIGYEIDCQELVLYKDGMLRIAKGFCWDGASGGIDTKKTIRASCAHDALYKLMRLELLPSSERGNSDKTLRDVMRKDGAVVSRVWSWFLAVSWFGKRNVDPKNKIIEKVAP